ncbi:hypothetical protein CMV_030631 [Castanea mollissima]|uniref:Uncharacterized protein n=1 Tax=Castanea mollissima TaxID=60419 RepID=A0A8J4Q5U1_9ROSI|nr:hypothetical protein CMV_030631 [Castanea mollissima]
MMVGMVLVVKGGYGGASTEAPGVTTEELRELFGGIGQPPSPPPSPATVVTQSLSTVTSLPPSQSFSSLSHDHLHPDLPSSLFPLVFPSLEWLG